MADINAAEKQQPHIFQSSQSEGSADSDKAQVAHGETAHEVAGRGHLATDKYVAVSPVLSAVVDNLADMAMRPSTLILLPNDDCDGRSICISSLLWHYCICFVLLIEPTLVSDTYSIFHFVF